jgi:hypothetical protein
VKTWKLIRELVRDIVSLGIGAWLAVHEALSAHPDGEVLLLALGCLVPSSIRYVSAVLTGSTGGPSSSSSGESEPSSSSPRAEDSGERPGS